MAENDEDPALEEQIRDEDVRMKYFSGEEQGYRKRGGLSEWMSAGPAHEQMQEAAEKGMQLRRRRGASQVPLYGLAHRRSHRRHLVRR